jgi:hypothetical protein
LRNVEAKVSRRQTPLAYSGELIEWRTPVMAALDMTAEVGEVLVAQPLKEAGRCGAGDARAGGEFACRETRQILERFQNNVRQPAFARREGVEGFENSGIYPRCVAVGGSFSHAFCSFLFSYHGHDEVSFSFLG